MRKETRSCKCREDEKVLRQGNPEGEREGIKIVSEKGAKKHRQQNLPTGHNCPQQQYWEYVKKAEGNIDFDPPIDDGDDRDEKRREYDPRGSLEITEKHGRLLNPTVNQNSKQGLRQKIACRRPKDKWRVQRHWL